MRELYYHREMQIRKAICSSRQCQKNFFRLGFEKISETIRPTACRHRIETHSSLVQRLSVAVKKEIRVQPIEFEENAHVILVMVQQQ